MQLRFYCRLIPLIIVTPALSQNVTPLAPMARDAHPSFAVVTIKPHDPDSPRQGFDAHGDRFTIRSQTVSSLLLFAYSIHPRQIVEAPDWALHDRYDIDGKTDTEGEPNLHQQQEMIQKLLADRFHLRFHRDKRELAVYAVRIIKGGPKLNPAVNPDAQPDQNANVHGTELTQIYTSAAVSDFILGMQFFLDRPLIDQTGLTGRYDFKLRYTTDELSASDANSAPGIFTAVQEQLGLKLEPVKAAGEVFVIDYLERPPAN
jgi:uncharacterized protein (TIGR03435 family)